MLTTYSTNYFPLSVSPQIENVRWSFVNMKGGLCGHRPRVFWIELREFACNQNQI